MKTTTMSRRSESRHRPITALVLAAVLTASAVANLARTDASATRPASRCSDFGCER